MPADVSPRPTGATEPLIRLRKVGKSYPHGPGRTWVLRQIDLDVREGEFVTVMGPSGSGKTTLLSILGFLDGEFEGDYRFLGEDVRGFSSRRRQALARENVGFVFQRYHLLDDLTVAENLALPLSYRNVKRKEREAIVADTLDRFNIVGKKDLYPNQLSGGQQQMVAVARAIIGEPKVILADEPTGSLHSSQGEVIMDLLSGLHRQGTTIVQVTHNEGHAARGERIVELKDGWIVAERDEG